jgi:hypothetical protein
MARTAVTYRSLVKNGNLIATTGATTIDATLVTNGVTIANAQPERTLIRVANTEGSTNVLTVKAGASPPALLAGQGDVTVTVAATSGVQYFGPFDSARVLQADGSMWIDFETAMTGTIEALLWPAGA